MNINKEILFKAAQLNRYNFYSERVHRNNSQCMLGFIGEAADMPDNKNILNVGKELGIWSGENDFLYFSAHYRNDERLHMNPIGAAQIIRAFAERF